MFALQLLPDASVSGSGLTVTADNAKIVPYVKAASSRETKNIPQTYTVSQTESLYTIAKRITGSGDNWQKIYLLNGLTSMTVEAGTVLQL
jgi:LysM repeat protein